MKEMVMRVQHCTRLMMLRYSENNLCKKLKVQLLEERNLEKPRMIQIALLLTEIKDKCTNFNSMSHSIRHIAKSVLKEVILAAYNSN